MKHERKKATGIKKKKLDPNNHRPYRRRIYIPNSGYIKVSQNEVAKTVDMLKGKVYFDFDSAGQLVGVEVL